MELCEGSVFDIMRILEAPLAENEICYVMHEVLKGLAYLHNLNKIHRDIKSANILLTSKANVKISFFLFLFLFLHFFSGLRS